MNSIQKDGTGQGFDISLISDLLDQIKIPVIIAGGAGNHLHLIDGLKREDVDAVATANLFNFLGDGLPQARKQILEEKINIAKWNI